MARQTGRGGRRGCEFPGLTLAAAGLDANREKRSTQSVRVRTTPAICRDVRTAIIAARQCNGEI